MSKFKENSIVVIIGNAVGGLSKILPIGYETKVIMVSTYDETCLVSDKKDEASGSYWFPFSSLQLKSEYDMQNKSETKRIPFDLERAKRGDKVIDNKGRNVRIVCFDRKEEGYPLLTLHDAGDREYCDSHPSCGGRCLFMAPIEREAYCIALRNRNDGGVFMASSTSETFDHAEFRYAESYAEHFDLISITKISWTE